MKKLNIEELQRLNRLLDESLEQASKEELAVCVRILAASLVRLKIEHNLQDGNAAQSFKSYVDELKLGKMSEELGDLAAGTIVECATVLAAVKEIKEKH